MDLVKVFRNTAANIMSYAKRAVYYARKDKHSAAAMYVTLAHSEMAVLKSLYYAHFQELTNSGIDEFVSAFYTFVDETTESCAEGTSHQHSYIAFNKLKTKYESSALAPR